MKAQVLGVGRPSWGPASLDYSYRYHHHLSSSSSSSSSRVTSGKATSKLHEASSASSGLENSTTTAVCISSSRLVASSHHRTGPISFVGLRGSPKKAKDAGKFTSRFGEVGGDCCQSSLGGSSASGSSRNCRIRRGIRATAGAGAQGSSSDDSRGDAEEEAGSSSVWDLPARHKRIKEAAAKVGDPFRDMMTNASKKLQDYLDNLKLSRSKAEPTSGKPESEWEGWQKVFAEVDERETLVSVLKFQLEEAVDNEDFLEAAKLKQTIASAIATDTVSEVMTGLKTALEEERYSDAARFRDKAAAGLVGWWVGLAEGGNDPYGRIIHIAASQGRFLAKSYSARQLATAGSGIPLFEVFLRKDGENKYGKQAVYLQREGNVPADTLMGPTSKDIDLSGLGPKNGIKEDLKTKDNPTSSDKSDDESKNNSEDFIDEGINNIISFLKDRIPDMRLKVLQVIAPDELEAQIPKLVEQMMEAEEKEDAAKETETEVSSSVESSPVGQSEQDKVPVGSSNSSSSTEEQETPIRLVIGGVLQNTLDDKVPRAPLRVAAKIEHKTKDEFLFHIEDTGGPSPASTSASTSTKESLPAWKVATIATQASADLMPDDVAKVLWNVEKVPVKVSKEMGEIIRLAVSQAQRRRGLSKSTSFCRINLSDGGTDPLSGLYIGAFGPYTSEVVQLRRKYGQWQEDESSPNLDKLEFFEYVEAVKLTGDLNVPAGQVTFRAKISRESRLSVRGAYPEELGVVGRYKGQGRLAEPGFRNPQWIDGEMVLLDGKGGGHTNGAELGFVYSVPERHFLVLFNRLKLHD